MPPIRTMPIVKPVRTERTHEENQERAYIAASRRSDRSLEARVESARRASEIHKKRTGRSLRVREEDVMNEEMYEEEDDDLPMQFRRINALHPGLAYSAFNERVNNYLAGQIGVRNYLHQAIYQANQSQYANHFLNPMLQNNAFQNGTMSPQAMNGNQQTPFPMANTQNMQPSPHNRSASLATPQEFAHYQRSPPLDSKTATPVNANDRRMSLPPRNVSSTGITSPVNSHPPTPLIKQETTRSPQLSQSAQARLSQGMHSHGASPQLPGSDINSQIHPLTTKLPVETLQLLDGTQAFSNQIFSSQMTPGIPMPSNYNYNPNGKSRKKVDSPQDDNTGLNQTLPQFAMQPPQNPSYSYPEPLSAASAPANLDFSFNNDMFNDLGDFGDSNYNFEMEFGSGTNNSGQVTPGSTNWNHEDFFNYSGVSD